MSTSIGYGVIIAGLWLGLSPYASNFLGYLLGLGCSFVLNRSFVFAASGAPARQAATFLAAFSLAYLANLAALHALLVIGVDAVAAQLAAALIYAATMYLLSRSFVFSTSPNALRSRP